MVDVTYSLFSINYHGGYSNNTGHYYCKILDFNNGIWWRCGDDIITQLRVIIDNIYSLAPIATSGKKSKNCDERF